MPFFSVSFLAFWFVLPFGCCAAAMGECLCLRPNLFPAVWLCDGLIMCDACLVVRCLTACGRLESCEWHALLTGTQAGATGLEKLQ
jgi:hypothetical protein